MSEALEDRELLIPDRYIPGQGVRIEPTARRVRVEFAGTTVADSTRALLLLEPKHLPVYYFPVADVRTELLEPTDKSTNCHWKGDASYWTIRVGDRVSKNAVWGYQDPLPEAAAIAGHVAFYWHRVDAWFEEDDEVFVHARDPYHRVDVLNSSRHVRVEVDGETVAESRRPRLLFETGLPTRFYLPKADVRMDLLERTDTTTRCPYKGEAIYWSARIGGQRRKDVAWSYPFPIPEIPKIERLLAFFNERVDLYVDGELQPRPQTPWS
jgi:uncharacterized protein (DUF427 family)